jgi:hypothetical protein
MKIKLLFFSLVLLATGGSLFAQNILPNISYNGQLTSSCSTPSATCANQVFVTTLGISGSPQTSGSGSTLDVPVQNYAAATITISGTYSGVTIGFDFSDPTAGTNYFQEVCARTDVNILEASEVVPTNQVRAWQCPVWAAMRFRVRASAYGSGAANINITLTQAAIDPSLIVAAAPPVVPGSTDPCQDLSQQKQSTFQNINTATTTALVAPSGTTNIYVCSYVISSFSTTTTNTAILENGTGASCATSPTALTNTYSNSTFTAPVVWTEGYGGTLFATGASQGLCVLSTVGSTPILSVRITYVQQ